MKILSEKINKGKTQNEELKAELVIRDSSIRSLK